MASPKTDYAVTIFTAETYPTVAGDGRNALFIGSKLKELEYGVKLVCLNPNGKLPKSEIINGVEINRLLYNNNSLLGRIAFRFNLLRFLAFQCNSNSKWIVYGAMPGYRAIITLSILKGAKCAFRSTLWGFDDAESLVAKPYWIYTRFVLSKLYGYYALNSSFAKSWQKIFGDFKILQVFQGVDIKKYDIKLKNEINKQLRDRLKIADDCFVILMVGHLIERKGFPEIADWLSRIEEDFLLLHVGSTEAPEWDTMSRHNAEMKNHKKYIEEKLGDRVRFLGRQTDLPQFYLSADILLVASYAEGYPPNSVNEALAAGLPVLTRRIAGVADAITDGVNGNVFFDEQEFTRKLSTLIHNPIRRIELGRNARIFAEDKLDVEKVTDKIQNFLGL
ncbi:MAG TPA: glycosyltransferase [Bacteroidales bacterium]|nr:glycosyltransferase [Bacteroidales bacterium]